MNRSQGTYQIIFEKKTAQIEKVNDQDEHTVNAKKNDNNNNFKNDYKAMKTNQTKEPK